MVFALSVGGLAVCISYLLASQEWVPGWKIAAPTLPDGFDVSAFTGVPWSVQATLVALVYPLVLSFIALTLQRKAHSTVSLRVYVLDSAVVPAGASSIGLLIALGIGYFATPYRTKEILDGYMAPLLIASGIWLLFNVLLTGFFLGRTLRFIQEEEQRQAFTRVAVDVILRDELVLSAKEHITLGAPQAFWGFPEFNLNTARPQVVMFHLRDGQPQVKRHLKGALVLRDVHLHLLRLAVLSWRRRAARVATSEDTKTPLLLLPPQIGTQAMGQVVLCAVDNGPPLNWLERALVKASYVYKPIQTGTLSLSAQRMLEELVGGVEAAAEQQRFGAANDSLREVLRLHTTLLRAAASDIDAIAGNAATIGRSPSSWGSKSFNWEWLTPYRDVARIAVSRLDDDDRLFRTLSQIPASIASRLEARPEQLLTDAQLVSTNLAHHLANWWTRKADASLAPGATSFAGVLPAPMSKVYERAVVGFIGSWNAFHVSVKDQSDSSDAERWRQYTGRAIVYAAHIDNTAKLLLQAVSRGDETASIWLLECFLKWWGSREFELEFPDHIEDSRLRNVTLTLAQKDWVSAQKEIWDGKDPVKLEFAVSALNLASRRYWESMRLYVVLLLIQNAGENPPADCRELRLASALALGRAQRPGGSIEAWSLDNVDDLLERTLSILHGIETPLSRIDTFAEGLNWRNDENMVPGWIYGWSGSANHLESMKRSLAILLVALADSRRVGVGKSKRLIEQWWRDLEKLDQVKVYLGDLRQEIRSQAFDSARPIVEALQRRLEKSHRFRFGQFAVSTALRKLRDVAIHERRITLLSLEVDAAKVRALAHSIGSLAFDISSYSPPVAELTYTTKLFSAPVNFQLADYKKFYARGLDSDRDSGLVEHVGGLLRHHLLRVCIGEVINEHSIKPINNPDLREQYRASHAEMRAYMTAIAARCSSLEATGETPVVLVGRSATAELLSAYQWGIGKGQCPPPDGITVQPPESNDGARARLRINNVVVYEIETPHEDCFVVPHRLLRTLVVLGTGSDAALTIEWHEVNEEQLVFDLHCRATFMSAHHMQESSTEAVAE
uniref:hypothetical protein n=1 Tax=unclassified Variovorax TaxID=663243 RepID=UPI00105010B0